MDGTSDRAWMGAPYNAAADLLGRNLVPGRAGRPYLLAGERAWSYEEVAAASDAAGAGLLDLGLGPGDRVMIATRDRPEFVFAFWGALKAGLVCVPAPPGLGPVDAAAVMAEARPGAVVFDEASARTIAAAMEMDGGGTDAPSPVMLATGEDARGLVAGVRRFDEVCGRPSSLRAAATGEDDVALWLTTSGTTGRPKLAMHRHGSLRAACGGLSEQIVRLTAGDVVLSASKMHYAYGLGNAVYAPAAAGAAVVVDPHPAVPAVVLDLMVRRSPTILYAVPSLLDGLARLTGARGRTAIRITISAGEALPEDVFDRFRTGYGTPPLDGLGFTETLHHVTSNRSDDIVAGSAGRALEGYVVEALGHDGEPVPEGADGELCVRGPTTFVGYRAAADPTGRALGDGGLRTGDLVRIVDGRVFHRGRLDDLMKLGGVWVAPREIESVLRGHPDVVDAAVVKVDDGAGVPRLRAVVHATRHDAALVRELRRLSRARLSPLQIPATFELVDELPRTPSGKLRRFELRSGAATAVERTAGR